jgi:Periplasmic copper-binding protein (NosD)/Intracellular proteinase inhibitor/Bacterial Ig domain
MNLTRSLPAVLIPLSVALAGTNVTVAQPLGSPLLTVDNVQLSWTAVPEATAYDVLRGDLATLRQTSGDFTASTRLCLDDDLAATSIPYAGIPEPGQAFWFLVRAVNATQAGSYNSGGAGQVGSRDAEIEASLQACLAPTVPHAPININGNAAFTAANGVVGGSGTAADPYLIGGWNIVCPSVPNIAGVNVFNTTLPFLIRNVKSQSCHYGFQVSSVHNGRIERSRASSVVHGVRLTSVQDFSIEGFGVSLQTGSGIDVLGSSNVLVAHNRVENGFVGINLDNSFLVSVHHNEILANEVQGREAGGGANAWVAGYPDGGNYWTDYQGVDHCGGISQDDCVSGPDGYGDTPYGLTPDSADYYPKMVADFAEGDVVPPTVAVTSPASGAVFSTLPVVISGTAADAGSGVRRVELSFNGGPWRIASGTTSWSLSSTPDSGTNAIQVRSLDHAGNVSAESSLSITYNGAIWEVDLVTDKATYTQGETVAIDYRITNRAAIPVTLHFRTTCQSFFSVQNSFGVTVFDLGAEAECFTMLTQRTWAPNETVTFHFTWDQRGSSGLQVNPGSYDIRGYLVSDEDVPDGVKTIAIVSPSPWGVVVDTTQASYAPGQAVPITLRVTNNTAQAMTLNFPSTCESFFDVENSAGTRIVDHGGHLGCFFVFIERTWQPGETVVYNFSWDQLNDFGQQVPFPANYVIRGYMDSVESVPDAERTISVSP